MSYVEKGGALLALWQLFPAQFARSPHELALTHGG
jgi:hypothetical protein